MHHANLFVGSREWALKLIPETDTIQGPDVSVMHYERMSIANVRTLIHESNLRPIAREYRTFIISCDSILHEAQNALLKLFEEPNAHTLFYIILPREDMLLPTLRSRLHVYAIETEFSGQNAFESFLKLSYIDRLSTITKKLGEEDMEWVRELVRGLALYAHEKRNAALIRESLSLESYININGSSKKMLLEHLALTL